MSRIFFIFWQKKEGPNSSEMDIKEAFSDASIVITKTPAWKCFLPYLGEMEVVFKSTPEV